MQDLEIEKYRLELIKHIVGTLASGTHSENEIARLALSIANAVIRALLAERALAASPTSRDT